MSLPRLVYLVEDATVAEIGRLCFLPAAEIVDRGEFQVGKAFQIGRISRLAVISGRMPKSATFLVIWAIPTGP